MKEGRRNRNEKVQPTREGEIIGRPSGQDRPVEDLSGENERSAKHYHELDLARLEGMSVEVSTMSAAQAAQILELLASIGLRLWMEDRDRDGLGADPEDVRGTIHRKDHEEQDAAA